ncbi:MAG TPA: hypothetical protein VHK45_01980 [Geminicoccaceae bacterium]|jgi:choline kinase|nr:hypothetical protein [Geminicoccaceae bacterium]
MGAQGRVRTCFNPDYRGSSLLSLWMLRHVLRAGEPVLYMDADVLYDWRLLDRLLGSARARLRPDRSRRSRPGMAGGADPG